MSGASERSNERMDELAAQYCSLDSWLFWPTVQCGDVSLGNEKRWWVDTGRGSYEGEGCNLGIMNRRDGESGENLVLVEETSASASA